MHIKFHTVKDTCQSQNSQLLNSLRQTNNSEIRVNKKSHKLTNLDSGARDEMRQAVGEESGLLHRNLLDHFL
jgi:hypothetical protein